jgi:hypothetical protein
MSPTHLSNDIALFKPVLTIVAATLRWIITEYDMNLVLRVFIFNCCSYISFNKYEQISNPMCLFWFIGFGDGF